MVNVPAPFSLEAQAPVIELTTEEIAAISGAGRYATDVESSHTKLSYVDENGVRWVIEEVDTDFVEDWDC